MKLSTSMIALAFCLEASAASDLAKAARCDWGYKQTASIIGKSSRDDLYPLELSSWELCKLAFDSDLNHEGAPWVIEALSFLDIPSNQIKPIEMLTKTGQCEVGSILFQKKFQIAHDHIAIKIAAKGICRTLPISMREDPKN